MSNSSTPRRMGPRLSRTLILGIAAVLWGQGGAAWAGAVQATAFASATIIEPVSLSQEPGAGAGHGLASAQTMSVGLGDATYTFKGPEGLVVSVWTTMPASVTGGGRLGRSEAAVGRWVIPSAGNQASLHGPQAAGPLPGGAAVIMSLN